MTDVDELATVTDPRLDGLKLERVRADLWIVSKVCETTGKPEFRTVVTGQILASLGIPSPPCNAAVQQAHWG